MSGELTPRRPNPTVVEPGIGWGWWLLGVLSLTGALVAFVLCVMVVLAGG